MPKKNQLKVKVLSRQILERYIRQILRIDSQQMSNFEKWRLINFKVELPAKFSLSTIALLENKIVGYNIVSQKKDTCHIHRIAVAAKMAGQGIGTMLITRSIHQAKKKNLKQITVETSKNKKLEKFYLKNNFRKMTGNEQRKYTFAKDKNKRRIFLRQYLVFYKNL